MDMTSNDVVVGKLEVLQHEVKQLRGWVLKIEQRLCSKTSQETQTDNGNVMPDHSSSFTEYAQNSTCHGISYIFAEDRIYFRKCLWLIFCLTCFSAYLFFASSAVMRYRRNPTSSSFELVNEDVMDFPAFTICHSNKVKKSYIEDMWAQGVFIPRSFDLEQDYIDFIKQQVWARGLAFGITGGRDGSLDEHAVMFYLRHSGLLESIAQNMTQNETGQLVEYAMNMVKDGSLEIDLRENMNFLNYTSFCNILEVRKENVKCKELVREKLQYDLELAYKGGHSANELLPWLASKCANFHINYERPIFLSCDITSYIDSNMGQCHTLKFLNNGTRASASRKNYFNFIEFEMFLNLSEFVPRWNIRRTADIFILFHDEDIGSMALPHAVMETGWTYDIGIDKTIRTTLSSPYTDCVDTNSSAFTNPLKYHNYSYDNCRKECENAALIDQCHCRGIGIPDDIHPPCSPSDLLHCEPANQYLECPACKRKCSQVKYLTNHFKLERNLKGDRVKFVLNFKELAYSHIRQVAAYPSESLFGDLGGNLGLFMGASLLSVMELVDLAVMAAWRRGQVRRAVTSDVGGERGAR